jgi:predicted Zn-dependent peptidase
MTEFYKRVLKNGVTVLFEKRNIPVISLSVNINSGSEFETEKEKGIHHVIEHMVFKGTKTRSNKQLASEVEKKGGILNGFTAEEMTAFLAKMPSKHLDAGFDVLSDIFLNPLFSKPEFEKEKRVIAEEIKLHRDNPLFYVSQKIKEMLYKKPFAISGAGTFESLDNMSIEQVSKHYFSDYGKKIVISAVGHGDFEHLCKLAERFPKCCYSKEVSKIVKINKEQTEKRKGIDQAHFMFGYHCPVLGNKKRYVNDIVLTYLAGGMSSVLHSRIRDERGLAYAVYPDIDREKNFGYAMIYVGTEAQHIKKIRELILKEFKNLKNIKQKDFQETKEQLIGLRKVSEEDSASVMSTLAFEEFGKKAEEYYNFEKNINAVKLSDVRNFKLGKFSTFSLIPDKK